MAHLVFLLSCFLYLQYIYKFWLTTLSFVAAGISSSQMYQLFFPYNSWDKYNQRPIFLWQSYSLNGPCRFKHNIYPVSNVSAIKPIIDHDQNIHKMGIYSLPGMQNLVWHRLMKSCFGWHHTFHSIAWSYLNWTK